MNPLNSTNSPNTTGEFLMYDERKLRANYTKAQGVSTVGIWTWFIKANELKWSDQMYRIFGIDKDNFTERLDEVIARSIHPDDKAAVDASNLSVVEKGVPIPLEYRVIWPDGTIKTVWAEAGELLLNDVGEPFALTGFVMDITEKKEIERQMVANERRFRHLVDASFDGLAIIDCGVIVDVSEKIINMFSPDGAPIVGHRILEFVAPESHEIVKRNMGQQNEYVYEFVAQRTDGSTFPAEVSVKKDTFEGRELLFAAIRDLTGRKKADRVILNAIIEAEENQRNRFSKELHDGLGPMLTTLNMYFEWLAEAKGYDKRNMIYAKGREFFSEALQTLNEISNSLSPRILVDFGIVPAIRTFIERLNPIGKIDFNFRYDSEKRFERNTEITLYRIVTELINNAIKHAHATSIQIRLMEFADKRKIVLEFTENGIGFNVKKVLSSGTGSGLYNITQRVNTLNGKIYINSIPDKGTVVIVELPLSDKTTATITQ